MGDTPTFSAPRAHPVVVADLLPDAVLAQAEEVARSWAIALVLARPLGRIGEIPLDALSREAPALCAQALRALGSEIELDRLTGAGSPAVGEGPAPACRLAAIAGASSAEDAVRAVEALRGVLWESLLAAMPASESARHVGDVADRLAWVCAGALLATLDSVHGDAPAAPVVERDVEAGGARERLNSDAAGPPPTSGAVAVIVDERLESAPATREVVSGDDPATPEEIGSSKRSLPWDESLPAAPRRPLGEIDIRDERREQGPGAWTRSIGRQLERFEKDGLPFAVLLVELLDRERLQRDGHDGELSRLAEEIESVLAAELRAASAAEPRGAPASLTQERPGRYWVLAPQTDRSAADSLAQRLRRAAQSPAGQRFPRLELAIGVAVCPADGREGAALAAHADVGLYAERTAARAATGGRPR